MEHGIWFCPECRRLHLACEDQGLGGHYGVARDTGQAVAPRCARHPGIPMERQDPREAPGVTG